MRYRTKLRKIPLADQSDRTRYAVDLDGEEIGQVWSKVLTDERRHWKSGRHATYVEAIYWTHGRTLELFDTRKEAVDDLLREVRR